MVGQQTQAGPHHDVVMDDIHDKTSSEDETEEEPSSMEEDSQDEEVNPNEHTTIHHSWLQEWSNHLLKDSHWIRSLETHIKDYQIDSFRPLQGTHPGTFLHDAAMDLWLLQLAHKRKLSYNRLFSGRKNTPQEHQGGQVWICPTDLSRDLTMPNETGYDLDKWHRALCHHKLHRRVDKEMIQPKRSKRVFRSLLFPVFFAPPSTRTSTPWKQGVGHWITFHLNIKR